MFTNVIIGLVILTTSTYFWDISADEENGHCIWYGVCDSTTSVPCAYDGPAKVSDDPDLYKDITAFCPEFIINATHVRTCCDPQQSITLASQLAAPQALLSRCPSAWDNFRLLICYMTCGPEQSLYIKTKVLTPVNSTDTI